MIGKRLNSVETEAANVVELADDIDEGGDIVANQDAVVLAGERADVQLVDKEVLEGGSVERLAVASEGAWIDDITLGGRGGLCTCCARASVR